MKIPTRPAPSVPRSEPARDNFYQSKKPVGQVKPKKKPPPRPPPPKFNNRKPDFTTSLIDLSAPLDDFLQASNANQQSNDIFKIKPSTNDDYFKSAFSNNSGYSELKSNNSEEFFKSKSSLNDDFFKKRPLPSSSNYSIGNSSFFDSSSINHLDLATGSSSSNLSETVCPKMNVVAPTIIRAQPRMKKEYYIQVHNAKRNDIEANNYSPPMPTIPPPSPPKYVYDNQETFDHSLPHGIALYNYTATHKDDLPLQVNDIIILLRQIDDHWLFGRIGDKKGMFPKNFIDIRVPLPDVNDNFVTALYEFNPETYEDLKLVPGQKIKVIKRISQDWLYGESNGNFGQFPTNFIDYVPANI